jgi:hypothetical protein
MNTALQLITMCVVVFATYLVFMAFGSPRERLLYTREERDAWNKAIGNKLSRWFTLTNIFGTLTSLATVYLFFIGSSKLFGYWTLLCSVTIWFGGYITNFFTKEICSRPSIQQRLNSPDQTGGVIAALFWEKEGAPHHMAALAKYLSLANIYSVIWLDFAIFADVSADLIGHPSIISKLILLSVSSFAVIYFTLRYGLRGFVFADLFQSPLLLIGSSTLLGGIVYLLVTRGIGFHVYDFLSPSLTGQECLLFAIQLTSLNFLLVLVTEPHWLRIWIFRRRETEMQLRSTGATAALWLGLILIGLFAFQLSGKQQAGVPVILGLLQELSKLSGTYLVAFWIGGMAALFASADTQIYSALLVNEFDIRTGQIKDLRMTSIQPLRKALLATIGFAVLYGVDSGLNLQFDKVMFIVLPVCLNLFPAFVALALGRRHAHLYVWSSLVLYVFCSVMGLLEPANQYTMTLLAPVVPIIVSGVVLLGYLIRRETNVSKRNAYQESNR